MQNHLHSFTSELKIDQRKAK